MLEEVLVSDRLPNHGISAYGRDAPIGVRASSTTQSAPSMVTQTNQQMQIPVSYADAVIGTAGASISYIRRISWATVTIEETRGVPGEMTVEIGGTTSQVQTAQQLIQNFMAEAAPSQPQGGTDQDFNSYPAAPPASAHASVYTSPPSNSGHAGGYGPVFGANYGF